VSVCVFISGSSHPLMYSVSPAHTAAAKGRSVTAVLSSIHVSCLAKAGHKAGAGLTPGSLGDRIQ
jgi:hypothetical protein